MSLYASLLAADAEISQSFLVSALRTFLLRWYAWKPVPRRARSMFAFAQTWERFGGLPMTGGRYATIAVDVREATCNARSVICWWWVKQDVRMSAPTCAIANIEIGLGIMDRLAISWWGGPVRCVEPAPLGRTGTIATSLSWHCILPALHRATCAAYRVNTDGRRSRVSKELALEAAQKYAAPWAFPPASFISL